MTATTIERGHIYFFYRPKVHHEHVDSTDDVRPPKFSIHEEEPPGEEMTLLAEGGRRPVPDQDEKDYRLLTMGEKRLPETERGREVFCANMTTVGDDLPSLERGLEDVRDQDARYVRCESQDGTKVQGWIGVRHEGAVHLAGRGVYAVVNNTGRVPSKDATHLAYHLTHPRYAGWHAGAWHSHCVVFCGSGQSARRCASVQSARRETRTVSDALLDEVFGRGSRGRREYGLCFTPCRCIELLEYEGAELLLIAACGDAWLGQALGEAGEAESQEGVEEIFKELSMDKDALPAEPLEGSWI